MTKELFFATVLKVLEVLFPPDYPIETVNPKDVAWAITEVTNQPDMAVKMIVQLKNESNMSARIQAGECKRNECDPKFKRGVLVAHNARGIWQVQDDMHGDLWEQAMGLNRPALLAGARLAHTRLKSRCSALTEVYSSQTGRGCVELALGVKRAEDHKRIMQIWYRSAQTVRAAEALRAQEKAAPTQQNQTASNAGTARRKVVPASAQSN